MTSQEQPRRKSKKGYNRTLKLVRRIHMYTGLLLLPWVIFFGFSGMLFNHPEWFGPVEVVSNYSAKEAQALGVEMPNAEAIADSVMQQINGSADLSGSKWVRDSGAIIEGALGYSGTSDKGRTMVQISPNHGSANVRYFINPPKQDQPDFHGKKLATPAYDAEKTLKLASDLVDDSGLELKGPLEASTRGGAEVRFQARSAEDDRLWNVSYSLVSNTLSARAADASSGLNFYSVVTKLHKTHHYPDRRGARWLWNAIADATGITMVFWGLSGAIMWWQIKPTRLLGIGGLGIAVVMAVLIFTGTFKTLTFGPTQSKGGPAKGAPASDKGRPSEKGRPPVLQVPSKPVSEGSIKTGPVETAATKEL